MPTLWQHSGITMTKVRLIISLFLLLTVGSGSMWGQTKVSDGIYYIQNNATNKGYLWPSVTTNSSTGYRYLTTSLDTSVEAVVNVNSVSYPAHDKSYSHWVVKNVTGGYIQLINPRLNQYVVIRKFPKANNTKSNEYGDRDIWLTDKPAAEDIDYTYFELNNASSPYKISPKAGLNGVNNTSGYSLNSAQGDDREWLTWSDASTPSKPRTGEGRGGLIQFYSDGKPEWSFTSDLLDAPTISDIDANDIVTVSDTNGLPEGYEIRYTTNGSTPTASSPAMEGNSFTVTSTFTLKAVVVRYGVVLTEVAEKAVAPAPCATPVITYDNSTSKVSITSTTPDCTIYYTIDGTSPTSLNTEYDGPFSIDGPTTIKAIATKSGYPNSEISSVRIVLSPTITLAQTEYTYSGSEIKPTVSSVMDGEMPIAINEYTVTYSNNTDAGTATVKIVDNADGDYIVYGSTNFTIHSAEVTLTANSRTEAYDGTEKTVSGFTCSVDGLTFESVSASGSGTNIGEYPVTFTGVTIGTTKDTSGNYVVASTINGKLTISPKPLTITAGSDTKVYDGTPLTKNSYNNTELIAGDQIESVTVTGSQTNAGTSDNVPSAAVIKNSTDDDVTANYDITYINGTLEVTKKTLNVTADAKSKDYGEADPALTYKLEGLINDDIITGTLSRESGESVGSYAITLGGLTAGNNYTISFTGANLTINKVGLTITANNHTITYGEVPTGNGVTFKGFVNSETSAVLGGTLDYDFSYSQYDDVGNTYTIKPKGLTSDNYEITFARGILTVTQKEIGINWGGTEFVYDGEEHAPTATATGVVNGDMIGITVTGAHTDAGDYTATASSLTGAKKYNYSLPEENTQSFTISRNSIGNGTTLADGYTIDFGEGNTILLTDNNDRTLVLSTDYEVGEDTDDSEGYSIRTVTGIGNYTGSFNVRNASVTFSTDTEQEGWSATFVAEKKDGEDIGFVLPEGFSAFIISDIRGEWAIPEPLNYIPADVPVLLVSHQQTHGFVATKAISSEVTVITNVQKENNMLEKVTEDTPGYDPDTQSAPFATKQIYILYKNEFVFNKAGNLKKGKVYLNPSHTAPSPLPAPAHLQIAWNQTTGLENLPNDSMVETQHDIWYTIDGRRLNGKPNGKGLYIVDGKKIVVK